MEIGVVTQADDIIVHLLAPHLVVEVGQDAEFGHTLSVKDNFCLRALLTARTAGSLEQVSKASPVVLAATVAFLQLGSRRTHRSPQHTVADLVTRLDVVGSGSGRLKCSQAITGVLINLLDQGLVVQSRPLGRRVLLDGISPTVAVVEVEHELHAGLLDATAQHLDSVKILDHTLPHVGSRGVGRIDKQTHSGCVPALLLGPGDDVINHLAVLVIVMCSPDAIAQRHLLMGLILGQHRDVTADDRSIVGLGLLFTAKDDVDHRVHIGDVHLAVSIHVGSAVAAAREDDVDNGIYIGNIHLAVIVHVPPQCSIGADAGQRQCQCK